MINKRISVGTFVVFSAAALATAQEPRGSGQPQSAPPPQAPAAAATHQPTTTLVGCLYREEQVPGRSPNIVERAGVLEDYILMDATIPAGQPRTGTIGGAAGTSGTMPASGNMYKVENVPDERLKALVGKRVEVTGRIDPEGVPAPARPGAPTGKPTHGSLGPDEINLPEFEAASIREILGTCPATPAPRK